MSNGLFVLDGSQLFNYEPEVPVLPGLMLGSNPVSSHLEFYYSNPVGNKLSVEVFDISGKRVAEQRFELANPGSEKFMLPVSQLASGIYIVSASDGSQSIVKKFLKSPY
jgi:hypothetical protein